MATQTTPISCGTRARLKPARLEIRALLRLLAKRFRRGGQLFLQTLREIFDENAYQRFLLRRGVQPSRAAYAEFLEEMRQRRERRVKCC